MKELSPDLPLWLRKKRAIEEFGLSEKRLRNLRKNRQVTHRLEGKEFLYETASLINYANGNSIPAEVLEPENGDERLIRLAKEVIVREKEQEVRNKEKNSTKEGDDA